MHVSCGWYDGEPPTPLVTIVLSVHVPLYLHGRTGTLEFPYADMLQDCCSRLGKAATHWLDRTPNNRRKCGSVSI